MEDKGCAYRDRRTKRRVRKPTSWGSSVKKLRITLKRIITEKLEVDVDDEADVLKRVVEDHLCGTVSLGLDEQIEVAHVEELLC